MYLANQSECPLCQGPAYRVRRRVIDRFVSLLMRRHRYRCAAIGCGWEGTLTVNSTEPRTALEPGIGSR